MQTPATTKTAATDTPSPGERILLTAHDLFYRDGVRATGIDRIIAEAAVTKVTFYRYFPSKNALIARYLQYRHVRWMTWFRQALQRHGSNVAAIAPALAEWFEEDGFRGCAFINGVAELQDAMPEVMAIAQDHKEDMTAEIIQLLPPSRAQVETAQALALAVDGAIIQAQMRQDGSAAIASLRAIVHALCQDRPLT